MVDRVLLGPLGGGAYGLKVSRPGFDVKLGTTINKRLAFDSRWPASLKIVASGQAACPASLSWGETLSTPPLLVLVWERNAVNRYRSEIQFFGLTGSNKQDQITTTGASITTKSLPSGEVFNWWALEL